jgi:hypothetical protein
VSGFLRAFKKHPHSVCTLHDVMGSRSGVSFVFFLSHGHILQLWQCVLTPWSVCKNVLVPNATPSKIIMLKESSMLSISSLNVLSVRCSVGGISEQLLEESPQIVVL